MDNAIAMKHVLIQKYQLALMSIVVLAVYYPAISAGFCSVDDLTMVQRMMSSEFSWIGSFYPGARFYYRPLLGLTYRFDQWVWDFIPSFMHLENIFLHLANTILVFFVAKRFFDKEPNHFSYGPLWSALLFGLHPLATESVNWISGRTDPLACFFILLSVLALFRFLESRRYRWVALASLAYVGGTLSKEVAVFFLPAAFMLLWKAPDALGGARDVSDRVRAILVFAFIPVLLLLSYLILRWHLHGARGTGMSDLVAQGRYGLWDLGRVFFKVSGFYIKKLFWPMPLNFAIIEIHDSYFAVGLMCLGGLAVAFRRYAWLLMPWLISVLLLLPGFFLAIADITWTPIAERYAYMSSAFWAIGLIGLWGHLSAVASRVFGLKLPWLVLIAVFSLVTVHRNLIWQDNLTFFRDSVAKSPKHLGVRNEYGNALWAKGDINEARRQYEIGLGQAKGSHDQLAVNLARVHMKLGQPAVARDIILVAMGEQGLAGSAVLLLESLAQANSQLYLDSQYYEDKFKFGWELLDVLELIFEKRNTPVTLFRAGQFALQMGEKKRAALLFARAHASSGPGDFFWKLSGELAEKTGNE